MSAAAGGSVNVSIGAVFAGSFKSVFGAAEKQMGALGGAVRALDGKLSQIKGLEQARQKTLNLASSYDEVLKSIEDLRPGIERGFPSAIKEYKKLENQLRKLDGEIEENTRSVAEMERGLTSAGVDVRNLAKDQGTLQRELDKTSNRMSAIARLSNTGIGSALSGVGSQFRSLATQATLAGAGLGYFFKRNFIDTAAEFERFQTILETTEGSAEAAAKSMNWVSDFAAKTPFELAEVTEAFVKLRAYGLDPTNGLLKTLGDTGAAMGKPVMQAVEAIADAVTGENERLKEFGIRASKAGDQITYEYTNRAGKQLTKVVDARNRAMIESTLSAIWNEKYGGAMDKLSGTWGGMMSNVGDQWTRFTSQTMNSGPFDLLKDRLRGVLAEVDKMAADGRLAEYAEKAGEAIVGLAEGAWEIGRAIASGASTLAGWVGGWKNLSIILVGLKLAPLIFSIGKLGFTIFKAVNFLLMFATGMGTAGAAWVKFGSLMLSWGGKLLKFVMTLGRAMLMNPIGLAITALGVAAYLLWDNWEVVKAGLQAVWESVKESGISAFNKLKSAIKIVIDWLASKTKWIFDTVDKVRGAAASVAGSVGGVWDSAKGLVGLGPDPSADTTGVMAPANAAPVSVVPASSNSSSVSSTTTITAPITINGATDPQATAAAVRAELDRRERNAAASRRGQMTDALGY